MLFGYLQHRSMLVALALVFSRVCPSLSQTWEVFAQSPNRCIEYCGCNCSAYYPDSTNTTCTLWSNSNSTGSPYIIKQQFPSYYRLLDTFIMCPSHEYDWLGYTAVRTVNVSGSCHMCPTHADVNIVPLAQIINRDLTLQGSGGVIRGDCPLLTFIVNRAQLFMYDVEFECTSGLYPISISGTQFNASFFDIVVNNADVAVKVTENTLNSNVKIINATVPNGTIALDIGQFDGAIEAVCGIQTLAVRVQTLIGSIPLNLTGCTLASPQANSRAGVYEFPGYILPPITNVPGLFILAIITSIILLWTCYTKSSRQLQRIKSKHQ